MGENDGRVGGGMMGERIWEKVRRGWRWGSGFRSRAWAGPGTGTRATWEERLGRVRDNLSENIHHYNEL